MLPGKLMAIKIIHLIWWKKQEEEKIKTRRISKSDFTVCLILEISTKGGGGGIRTDWTPGLSLTCLSQTCRRNI